MKNKTRYIPNFGVCASTTKHQYDNSGAAKVATNLRRKRDTNHAEYHCSDCGWWHVGSTINRKRRLARSARLRPEHRHQLKVDAQ